MLKLMMVGALGAALSACASHAHNNATQKTADDAMKVEHHKPHIRTVMSGAGFDQTLSQLQAAIDNRGFKTFAVIDHAKGAASIDQPLRATILIIFGNPKGGTPLIQADQRLGLELPLKILVTENEDGGVNITYRDYMHTIHEYGALGQEERVEKVMDALAAISQEAGQAD